jgi:hypothetical protein
MPLRRSERGGAGLLPASGGVSVTFPWAVVPAAWLAVLDVTPCDIAIPVTLFRYQVLATSCQ